MPSRAVIVVCALALAFTAARVQSGRASEWNARAICASHVCRTIVSNPKVRVFRATDRHGYDIVFAEWRLTHHARVIDFPRSEPLTATTLAGPVVAHAVRYGSGTAVLVYVEDLQPKHGARGGSWVAAQDIEAGSAGVKRLAVTASGSVAWLVEGRFLDPANPEAGPHANARAVFCAAGTGNPVLLAYGQTAMSSDLHTDASHCSPQSGPH